MTAASPPSPRELREFALMTATVRLLPGRFPPRYPVPLHCGVPVSQGKLTGEEPAWLIGPNDEIFSAQTDILSRWPDGSVRWVLIEVLLAVESSSPTEWTVVFSTAKSRPESPTEPVVQPGLDFAKSFGVELSKSPLILGTDGKAWQMLPTSQALHEVRSAERLIYEYPFSNHEQSFHVKTQYKVYSLANPLIRIEVRIRNSRRAKHVSGLWDLGDEGSVFFRGMSLGIGLTEQTPVGLEYQLEPGAPWADSSPRFSVHQESSGGEHWNSVNHINRTGKIPCRYRGFVAETAAGEIRHHRATPAVRILSPEGSVTATIPKFWQQFPMSIFADVSEQDETVLLLHLLAQQVGHVHELQGGEQKTHTIWLKLNRPDTPADQLDLSWVHDPPRLVPVLDDRTEIPGWPTLHRLHSAPVAQLNELCDAALNGPENIFVRREEIDEYGWRNFGDFFADHELAYYKGPPPLISHFNNQYDVLGGLLLQGLRTEEVRWWELADDLMRHVTDIDLYHTQEDRAVYNGGLFWLTDHYTSCGTATHRTFSKLNAVPGKPYGGGPGCEHNYTTGLLAYYWLTGERAAGDAVTQLADWVIAMDDGRQTLFGLIDDGPTGTATATVEVDFHGPGRGAGNSINALLDAWLLTSDRRYLLAAESFLQRCIHPADEIARHDLLNFELRWSYTVFLMAVFKYLECKQEAGEVDGPFEFARQSLLHYARWMADHERPYFDRTEQMEFPTETWAAQELRKANVFRWAAIYADDEKLRSLLTTRGLEFAERAWRDLWRFPTRTFIRPFTLAMIQGLWDAALRAELPNRMVKPPDANSWGAPRQFITQKNRVRQMLTSPRGILKALSHAAHLRRWKSLLQSLRRMR